MPRQKTTHCKYGHKFTPDNTYIRPSNGKRSCRICLRRNAKHWRSSHPIEVKQYLHLWYQENKEEVDVRKRQWVINNLEKERERKRKLAKEHPEWSRKAARKRRALKKSQLGLFSDFEEQIIPKIRAFQKECCCYCGILISVNLPAQDPQREVLEHPQPLSRGGVHGIENWALSCFSCNARKGDKTASEFLEILND